MTLFLCLIRDRHIIGAKNAEQIELLVALRENTNLFARRGCHARGKQGCIENPASSPKYKSICSAAASCDKTFNAAGARFSLICHLP